MKNFYFKTILFCFCLLSGTNVFAYDAEIDGIYYNFSGDEAIITYRSITKGGYSGNVIIPASVKYNDITYAVTAIGEKAFSYCTDLILITLPESVTSIGDYSFRSCSGLISVTIPNSVTSIGDYAFQNCTGLTSITIPNRVTSIGNYAFYGCRNLISVSIPSSVTSIGGGAFQGCTGLTAVNITDLTSWCNISFYCDLSLSSPSNPLYYAHHLYLNGQEITDLVIPEGVTSICSNAFSDCTNLTSVSIPSSVTKICKGAFYDCTGLTAVNITDLTSWCNISFDSEVDFFPFLFESSNPLYYAHHLYLNGQEITDLVIPENVTSICGSAFSDCTNLASVSIPGSVTSIGGGAFQGCTGLTSIAIPNSVTNIGGYAFQNCSRLMSVTIPKNVTTIAESTFYGCTGLASIVIQNSVNSIEAYAFAGCTSLTSVTIPNNVTSIGESAFLGCTSLTSVTIPNSVTSIGEKAFAGCTSLTSVIILDGAMSIGESAFSDCTNLISATIGSGVTSIGSSAFKNCKLRNLLVKCAAPPTIGGDAFTEQTLYHTTLYVPVGCWDAYAYDNTWYKFHNIRETATTEEEVSTEQAYTLMDAGTFAYSVYDPVNDQINTINSAGINEDNPNHSWQMIEGGGMHFLYNIGTRKYVKRNGTRFELTEIPEPIDVEDGENGIILGAQTAQQWALVSNEHMNVAQSAIDEVTGISDLNAADNNSPIYNLAGQRLSKMQKGINIRNGRKVLIK